MPLLIAVDYVPRLYWHVKQKKDIKTWKLLSSLFCLVGFWCFGFSGVFLVGFFWGEEAVLVGDFVVVVVVLFCFLKYCGFIYICMHLRENLGCLLHDVRMARCLVCVTCNAFHLRRLTLLLLYVLWDWAIVWYQSREVFWRHLSQRHPCSDTHKLAVNSLWPGGEITSDIKMFRKDTVCWDETMHIRA